MTNYPNNQDNSTTLPGVSGLGDGYIATNALRDAVFAIEEELGITPSGVYSDVRVRLDILEARINNPLDAAPNVEDPFIIGNNGVTISTGVGYPTENRVSGSLYLRRDGYVNEQIYTRRPDGYWYQIDSGTVIPSGDLTGVTDWSNIQTLLNDGYQIKLGNNETYYLSQPLVPISGTSIFCSGKAVIKTGSSWANLNALDPLNALITCLETESAQAATTVSAATPSGTTSIPVTSATGFSANSFFKITGWNSSDFWEQSASQAETPTEELFQVTPSYVSGTSIPLVEASILFHDANGANKPVKLLTSIVENFSIEGVRFDGYGVGIASAVFNRFARNIIIKRCEVKGFGGRAFNSRGSKHINIIDCIDIGANNCLVQYFSCQRSLCSRFTAKHEVKMRYNTAGGAYPLYHYTRRSQCRDVIFEDCTSLDACGGFLMWGGVNCHEYRCHAVTPNLEPLFTHAIANGGMQLGLGATESGIRGWAFDGGGNAVGATGFAEFGFGNSHDITDHDGSIGSALHYSDLDIPNRWHMAFYFHDDFDAKIQFSTISKSLAPLDTTRKRYLGFKAQDCSAYSGYINCLGTYAGAVVDGVYNILDNIELFHNPRSGVITGDGLFHLFLEGGIGLHLKSIKGSGCSDPIMMGTIVDGGLLYRSPIAEYAEFEWSGVWNQMLMRNLVIARRPDGYAAHVPGVAYELDPAGTAGKRDCFGAVATAGTGAGIVAVSSAYAGYTGTQRYFVGVELGDGCTTPILALGAIGPKVPLELDSNGKAIALTSVTPGELTRCIGRNTTLTAGAAVIQIGT